MIKHTDKSLTDISHESGFSDYKYLNQMMKDKYNLTALRYRKELHEKKSPSHSKIVSYHFIQELKDCISRLEGDKRYNSLFNIENI